MTKQRPFKLLLSRLVCKPKQTARETRRCVASHYAQLAVGGMLAISLCSCQSVAPHQSVTQLARPAAAAADPSPLAAQSRYVSDENGLVADAAVPSPPLPAGKQMQLVSHSGPLPTTTLGAAGQAASSVLGTTTCACGRAPSGLCACAQGSLQQMVFASDEYLCNGGDRDTEVLVKGDWSVHGLHSGDTVAHFDTLNGDLKVVHSNELCIYAPRFAAVRRVSGVVQHEQHQRGAGVELADRAISHHEHQVVTTVKQPLQPQRHLSVGTAQRLRERRLLAGLEGQQSARGAVGDLLPFEDFSIVRHGQFDDSQKARLATRLQAAIAWSSDLSPQVVIDARTAVEASGDDSAQSVFRFDMPPGKPRLRIVKLASTEQASPGDLVEFTLRFDNIGDQVIGNVTLIDRLVTRLEYVSESQSATVDAEFFVQENPGDSMVLRWELAKPLEVGEGGVVRFQARVR